jgi:peptide/nickel transport system substrate-binding protein
MKLGSKAAAIAAIAAATLAVSACGGGTSSGAASSGSQAQAHGGTLTIAASVDVKSFDPAQSHIGHYLQYDQPVYDSLIRRKPDGSLVPMLATKWQYNSDKTVLTLNLRSGVKFSDGTTLDANAVKINLDRFRTGNGPDASTMALVQSVDVKDPGTVVITLKSQDPSLLDNLANADGFVASPQAIEAGKIATAPVGSGPYTLDASATVAGSTYTFVKSKDYWDPSLQVYDKIVVKPILDPTATLNALMSGQVNAATINVKSEAQAKNAGMTEYKFGTDWQGLVIYDRDGKMVPALKDPRVRQAINYAIDKDSLIKQVFKGLGTKTSQVFGTTTDTYDKSLDDTYSYDPAKAKALLAEAGFGSGFTVTMPMVAGFMDPAMVAGLGQNLADVGIKVDWVTTPGADFISGMTQGKWPIAWFSLFQGSPWTAANQILTPNATYNPFHTTDPKVTGFISTIQTGSEADQATAAKDLNKYVTDQAWFAPVYRPDFTFFTDKNTTTAPQARQAVPSIYNYAPKK